MSNISHLGILCHIKDVTEHGWNIMLSHVIPTIITISLFHFLMKNRKDGTPCEVPKRILIRIQRHMCHGVDVSAIVAHPHVVSGVTQDVRQTLSRLIHDPPVPNFWKKTDSIFLSRIHFHFLFFYSFSFSFLLLLALFSIYFLLWRWFIDNQFFHFHASVQK